MTKRNIEIDQYVGFDVRDDGTPLVYTGMFIGDLDYDNPVEFTLEEVLDEFIEMNTIPNGTIRASGKQELLGSLLKMAEVLKTKYDEVEALPLWEQKNG